MNNKNEIRLGNFCVDNKTRLSNSCISIKCENFKKEIKTDEELKEYLIFLDYLSYFIFQREYSEEKGEHWQMYLEFNKQQYFSKLKKDLGEESHIEKRKWKQISAINYCRKSKSKIGNTFEWGIPKKSRVWNKRKRTNKGLLDIYQCKVIWIFGESGSGKTTYTDQIIRKENIKEKEIAMISPLDMSYNERIKFKKEWEKKRVLLINEVDESFPKHNNLISFIDRKTPLLSFDDKEIKNNFELIMINSIYRPEEVFGYLGKRNAAQVLRRIFNPIFDCKVYEIKANKAQIKRLEKEIKVIKNIKFQDWYKPKIIEIKKPDYSLISKE